MNQLVPLITIDGPSGSGKGTISKLAAERLGYHLLDSGALYRLLAHAAQIHAISLEDEQSLATLAGHLDVQFLADNGDETHILLEGEDVTDLIRTEECGKSASIVAVLPAVRMALLSRQRAFHQSPGLVADGRDMGTVVFPEANVKYYLTASVQERAKRRYKQLKEKGMGVNLANLSEEIAARDDRDTSRTVAPLKPADDAMIVDTTNMSIDEVVSLVMSKATD